MPDSVQEHRVPEGAPEPPRAPPRARRDLLRALRHDLRTPINHILGYSELLLDAAEELGEAAFIPSIQKIQTAGQALLAHVDRFLDASRVQTGALELDPASYEFRTQLNAVIGYSDMLHEEAGELGHADLAADFRKIHAAGNHLLGVVNAFIELSKAEVAPGAEAALASGRAGAGQDEAVDLRPEMEARSGPPAEPASVLVVDDNEINRDLLARRLERLGCRVALAEHGRAALERLRAEPFDLVLLDILMPELNGYQVLARVKSDPSLRHIPVIVLSAMDEVESIVRCIELGAEDYLVSPFNPVLLKARIGACLDRKRMHEALARQALHDALTGLPNRTLLYDRLRQALLAARREQTPLALLWLDLDHFKEVNDTLGHQVGDALLQQVGQRLERALRASDTVARLGGDEFAVILPGADLAGATLAAAKLLQALEEPYVLDARRVEIGASFGIALYPEHAQDGESLLRRADDAMYAAKRAGGGYAVCAPA
ncbi:MAG: diguanylate cyclase [Chloroflexi bacterium]|nr:diguanylate cyclase [Chloroflexota bacterium]